MDAPVGLCLICAHVVELAIYRESRFACRQVGVCAACRDLAVSNRGPCSPERNCYCATEGDES